MNPLFRVKMVALKIIYSRCFMKKNYFNFSKRFLVRSRSWQTAYFLLLFLWSGFLTPSIAQNYAVNFDGTDDYIGFSSYPPYNSSTLTIEAWIKTTSTSLNQVNDIVGWNSSGNDAVEFRVYNGKLEFGVNTSSFVAVTSSASVNTGNWTHVAVVKNGSSVTLYINGQPDGSSNSFTQNLATTGMRIGSLNYSAGSLVYYFQGGIDEVRIWHTARSQSEISSNMYNQLTGGETGLVAYYPLREGSGTATNDAQTSSSHDGTLTNGPSWTFFDPLGTPGVAGASLWLKANQGAANNGSDLTGWTDQTAINAFTKVGSVGYQLNRINFNPEVSFTNTNLNTALPSNRIDANTSITFVDGFAVYRYSSPTRRGALIGGTSSATAYGPAIFSADNDTRVYAGNGVFNTYQSFNNPTVDAAFSVANLDVSLASSPFASGRLNGAVQTITQGSGGDFTNIALVPMIGGTNNTGGSSPSNGWNPFHGEVAEMILFPTSLSNADKLKVESYLALKYGITLDPSVVNYVGSAGTNIWSHTTHWHDVFGIGKDDGNGLNQTQSNSMNTGSGDGTGQSGKVNIVLKSPSSLDNGDFLVIGHDNNPALEAQPIDPEYDDLPARLVGKGVTRLRREWKIKHTGNVGSVTVEIDLNGITTTGDLPNGTNPGNLGDFGIMIDLDGDGDFTTGTVLTRNPQSFGSPKLIFNTQNLPDNAVFTIATNGGANILPATIIRFNGNANQCMAQLEWITATETNLKAYEVQVSRDNNNNWKTLFTTAPKNQISNNYAAAVPMEKGQSNFYRLKMVDKDGTVTYSSIISLQCNGAALVNVYPNPARDKIQISGTVTGQRVKLTDLQGRQLSAVTCQQGITTIDIQHLPAATYLVLLFENNKWKEAGKFVKN